jgi:hypothetical protein
MSEQLVALFDMEQGQTRRRLSGVDLLHRLSGSWRSSVVLELDEVSSIVLEPEEESSVVLELDEVSSVVLELDEVPTITSEYICIIKTFKDGTYSLLLSLTS